MDVAQINNCPKNDDMKEEVAWATESPSTCCLLHRPLLALPSPVVGSEADLIFSVSWSFFASDKKQQKIQMVSFSFCWHIVGFQNSSSAVCDSFPGLVVVVVGLEASIDLDGQLVLEGAWLADAPTDHIRGSESSF